MAIGASLALTETLTNDTVDQTALAVVSGDITIGANLFWEKGWVLVECESRRACRQQSPRPCWAWTIAKSSDGEVYRLLSSHSLIEMTSPDRRSRRLCFRHWLAFVHISVCLWNTHQCVERDKLLLFTYATLIRRQMFRSHAVRNRSSAVLFITIKVGQPLNSIIIIIITYTYNNNNNNNNNNNRVQWGQLTPKFYFLAMHSILLVHCVCISFRTLIMATDVAEPW